MKKNKKINYSIGLDIGTSSVGWAVTDEKGDLQRFKGKFMLGSSLFESAETAAGRRGFRSTRRRIKRRQVRIDNLQSLLSEEMNVVDPLFFRKMEESKLYPEHKTADPLNLQLLMGKWDGSENIDKKQFKTIFHLRNHLMETEEKVDIRLVYLALHHAIKYRGNFLYQDMADFSVEKGLVDSIEEFLDTLSSSENYEEYDKKIITEIENIIKDKKSRNRDKELKLTAIFIELIKEEDKAKKKSRASAISKAIIGFSADYTKIFDIEGDEKISFKLSEEKAETELDGKLSEEDENIYITLKNVYSAYLLNEILKGEKSVSKAMIAKYNEHKKDLDTLKKLIKENYKEGKVYNSIFRNEDNVYEKYTKNTSKSGLSQEEFYKEIKKILEKKKEELKENKEYSYCMEKIADGNFLSKLNTTDNGAIPFQLHSNEVKRIIERQGKYYPELEKNSGKIVSILEFRIPYYVGPLNEKSDFAWLEKNSKEEIKPWNFTEVVNLEKSAENFILRMTNNCTYLLSEKVIPKNSLLYSEFMVLNELNKISIGGRLINTETKNYVLEELFKNSKGVNKKKLQEKLKEHKHLMADSEITGFQKENSFASSLTTYIDFKKILGKVDSSNYEMIEKIILWITLFEDKKILEKRIKTEYSILSQKQVKDICKLRYKGWSRLSEKLITGLKATGNIARINYQISGKSIIEIMRETNENFMQIIENNDVGIGTLIEKENSEMHKGEDKITYKDVQELPGSPALKKGVWHSVKVIKEIVDIMGCNPKNIYLEVAREDQVKGKRTNSRYYGLKKIYDSIESDIEEYRHSINELRDYDKAPKELDSERLYLYFIQNGKCMYTGEHLEVSQLSNYDVDHILPQSYIKDDSLNNKVLVKSTANRRKNDTLLLSDEVIKNNKGMWTKLLKSGLMTTQKYSRLIRPTITDEDKSKFIARQLVETSQIIKNVVNLLKVEFKEEETKINLIKSNLVSNLRKQYELYKHRDLNDFHHAHDAYFLCTLGTFVESCYPSLFEKEFNYEGYRKDYEKSIKDGKNKYGWLIYNFGKDIESIDEETGEIIRKWQGEAKVSKLKNIMNYRNVFVTKKVEEQTGEFYNQTLYSPKDKKDLIPQNKNLDAKNYGGYSGINQSYYSIIEYKKGKKVSRELVGVPIMFAKNSNDSDIIKYFEKLTGATDIKVIVKKISKHQRVNYENNLFGVVAPKEVNNGRQLVLSYKEQMLLSEMRGTVPKLKDETQEEKEIIQNLSGIKLYGLIIEKIRNEYPCFVEIMKKLEDARTGFNELPLRDKGTNVDKNNFINEILKVLSVGSSNGNFKRFSHISKLTEREGRMPKTLQTDKIEFINTSITGMREKRYTLKDLEV